jgi:hypothetical protein
VSVYPLISFQMRAPVFMKLGMHITAPEPISTAYFINPSHQSVCLYVYPHTVARQQLGKNVTASMNTHATTVELLDVFYMRSVLYQRKIGDQFFPELLAFLINSVRS